MSGNQSQGGQLPVLVVLRWLGGILLLVAGIAVWAQNFRDTAQDEVHDTDIETVRSSFEELVKRKAEDDEEYLNRLKEIRAASAARKEAGQTRYIVDRESQQAIDSRQTAILEELAKKVGVDVKAQTEVVPPPVAEGVVIEPPPEEPHEE